MGMTGGTLTPKQLKCIYALGRAGCMDSEELHGVVYTAAKKEHVSELTVEEARRVIDRLKLLTGEKPKRAADRATKGQVQLIYSLAAGVERGAEAADGLFGDAVWDLPSLLPGPAEHEQLHRGAEGHGGRGPG